MHGETGKAAAWLAPLAVAKLTPEDALKARKATTPEKHVERRMALLGRARRKVLNTLCNSADPVRIPQYLMKTTLEIFYVVREDSVNCW